jgi:predicted glycosyltransferase
VDLPELVRPARQHLIKSATLDFAPDLVLVDKKPFGVQGRTGRRAGDAVPRGAPAPLRAAAGIATLDSAEATPDSVWQKNGYYEARSTPTYDEVLVVGSPEIFDLRREYAFSAFAAAKVALLRLHRAGSGETQPRPRARRARRGTRTSRCCW